MGPSKQRTTWDVYGGGGAPSTSHQKPYPSSVDVTCGWYCNCNSQSMCSTRRCTCHCMDHLCTNCDCGNCCHQRTTDTHPNCPPGSNPVDGKNYSSGTLLEPPPLPIPTHWLFNNPLYMKDNTTKADMKICQCLRKCSPPKLRDSSLQKDNGQQIMSTIMEITNCPDHVEVWSSDRCGQAVITRHYHCARDGHHWERMEFGITGVVPHHNNPM